MPAAGLAFLLLGANGVANRGARAVVRALWRHRNTLRHLDLSDNPNVGREKIAHEYESKNKGGVGFEVRAKPAKKAGGEGHGGGGRAREAVGPEARRLVTALAAAVDGNVALRELQLAGTSLPKAALQSLNRTIEMNSRFMSDGEGGDEEEEG